MFGNVHTLNLSECQKITDVSMLINVNTLDLEWCNNIPKYQIVELNKTFENLIY